MSDNEINRKSIETTSLLRGIAKWNVLALITGAVSRSFAGYSVMLCPWWCNRGDGVPKITALRCWSASRLIANRLPKDTAGGPAVSLDPHNALSCKCRTQKSRVHMSPGSCALPGEQTCRHGARRWSPRCDKCAWQGKWGLEVCVDKCRPIFIVDKHLFFSC